MNIKRLELKAFGPFSGELLDFSSPCPGLHIVYGPNEAGKSSAMRALQALFFGFPVRTGDNFLHQNQQLLVGGCLQGGDGQELAFFRRKRSVKDLFDQYDNPIEPSALTPWLHGVEKELFLALYGINHETLVMGGQGILDQQGEVGKALFAAGAGLASLKPVIDELEREGESLFTPKASIRSINEALACHKELLRQSKEATLSCRDWEEYQQALDDALKRLTEKQKMKQELETEKRRLERLHQALPDLSDRKNLLCQLAELGEVTALSADFSEHRVTLEQREREARIHHEQVTGRLQALREQMAGHSLNQRLLDEAATIEELHQRLGEYRKGKNDRPLREGQRISARTDAAALLRQIKPDLTINEVENLRPGLSKRRTLQDLASRHEALLQGSRNAKLQLQEIEKALERVDAEKQQLPPVAETVQLSRVLLAAERAGDIDTQIINLEHERHSGERACLAALNRLGLWKGSLQLVLSLPLPLVETVNLFDEEFRVLTDNKRQLQAESDELEKQQALAQEQIQKIVFASDVPSKEELAKNRSRREQGWQLLRRQWIEQEDVAEESRSYDSRHPLPEAYERMVGLADQTADRLYREAELVEKYASLKADAEKSGERLAALREKEASADKALAEFRLRWLQQWASTDIIPLSPREMIAWLGSFENLRILVREFEKNVREVDEKKLRRRELQGKLLKEIAAAGAVKSFIGEELYEPLDYARALLNSIEAAQRKRVAIEGKLCDGQRALESAVEKRGRTEDELKEWQAEWSDAVIPLGLDGKVLPSEALDFIETLQACFEKLKEADDFRKRIEGIDRDIKNFEGDIELLVQKIASDLTGVEAHQVITELKLRLGRASQEQAVLLRESEELEILEKALITTETDVRSCEEELAAMRHSARCETQEELIVVEQRSAAWTILKNRQEELERNLSRIAGGITLADLEIQADFVNPDELPGQINTLNMEIVSLLDPEINQLTESIGRKKNELDRMDGNGRAAELADALQYSLTKIRRLTERYIRIKLAAKMLRDETERYRLENEAPVLKIASRYFTELTMSSFIGLRTDSDDHGKLVLAGVRPHGSWLQVEAMSSGTRDQLYLALRLATLEWRTESSEPMPFIVDDILINFDDKRSQATIKALSELGEKSQVILFTHHQKIVEMAGEPEFAGKVFIHRLEGRVEKGV
jgi:uncharacterized protein YhaN